jgi:hypothetical protein
MKIMKLPNCIFVFPLWEIIVGVGLRNFLFLSDSLAMACGWDSNNYLKIN